MACHNILMKLIISSCSLIPKCLFQTKIFIYFIGYCCWRWKEGFRSFEGSIRNNIWVTRSSTIEIPSGLWNYKLWPVLETEYCPTNILVEILLTFFLLVLPISEWSCLHFSSTSLLFWPRLLTWRYLNILNFFNFIKVLAFIAPQSLWKGINLSHFSAQTSLSRNFRIIQVKRCNQQRNFTASKMYFLS